MSDNILYIAAGLLVLGIIIICAVAFRKGGSGGDMDEMSGAEFEDFAAEILHRSGIEVLELTKGSGDFGADIIVMLDGERTAVQCKRYSRPIGVKAVQEVVSAKAYYKCTRAAVITNSTFTRQAEELAAESNVILWDREAVYGFMNTATGKSQRKSHATLKFCRLKEGEESGNSITVYINGEPETLLPNKATILTADTGECTIHIKYGMRKAALKLRLGTETRTFAVGIYKNKPFLMEIG